jgi:hypothetical protein
VIGHEDAQNTGENEPAEADVTSGTAPDQALHDHEDFIVRGDYKVFVIM